ncbi:hypothetical protein ACQPWY_12660 [Pseudonocardia xinjiangensis]|uniref:hypothetical protein n=1 Tax=Pseudonocardia xinjiangensis TaxID=75289 RepID=UPI003D8EDFE6
MNDLLSAVLEAHGGLERWNGFSRVRASIVTGGELWGIKGLVQDPAPRLMTVALHEQWASVQPFGSPDQKTAFTRDRIAIEKLDGQVVAERIDPRESFSGHELTTPWDASHRAYFNGYALWTYLTTPFLLAMPGFSVSEIDPVEEHGQRWRGLQARFPPRIAGHSTLQEFYVGEDHLLRRHDYRVDVAGGFAAVQYVHDIIEVDGFRLPSKRLAYRCGADGRANLEQLMVSIELSDVHFVR